MEAAHGTKVIPVAVDRIQEDLLDVIYYASLRCMMIAILSLSTPKGYRCNGCRIVDGRSRDIMARAGNDSTGRRLVGECHPSLPRIRILCIIDIYLTIFTVVSGRSVLHEWLFAVRSFLPERRSFRTAKEGAGE